MKSILSVAYGAVCYLVFLPTLVYVVGFLGGWYVPKTIDTGVMIPWQQALVVDVLLLGLFGVQHSVMARQGFKHWWTRLVPVHVERSTYVLFASLVLLLMFWQWRPIPANVWNVENSAGRAVLLALF